MNIEDRSCQLMNNPSNCYACNPVIYIPAIYNIFTAVFQIPKEPVIFTYVAEWSTIDLTLKHYKNFSSPSLSTLKNLNCVSICLTALYLVLIKGLKFELWVNMCIKALPHFT